MAHPLLTTAFLIAALVCYGLGLAEGGGALLVAGVVCEGVFWVRVLRRPRGFRPPDQRRD